MSPARLARGAVKGALLVLAALAVMALIWKLTLRPALAHDHKALVDQSLGDPARADWFSSLKTPGGVSCCSLNDCRETEARQLADGSWEAIVTSVHGAEWKPIPPAKVLAKPLSIDGAAYICNSPGSKGGQTYGGSGAPYMGTPSDPVIFCFVPPITMY